MNATAEQHNWARFISLFNERNRLRPTRLGVFDCPPRILNDLWLEDGLTLAGIDMDTQSHEAPDIEIMLNVGVGPETGHMTHIVKSARFVKIILSAAGDADGIEIEGADSRTTILRFEK